MNLFILLADCLQAPPQNLYVRYSRFFFLFSNGNKPGYLAKAVSAIKCINFCFEKFNDMEWNENEIIWIVKFEENCFANLLLIWRFLLTIHGMMVRNLKIQIIFGLIVNFCPIPSNINWSKRKIKCPNFSTERPNGCKYIVDKILKKNQLFCTAIKLIWT